MIKNYLSTNWLNINSNNLIKPDGISATTGEMKWNGSPEHSLNYEAFDIYHGNKPAKPVTNLVIK